METEWIFFSVWAAIQIAALVPIFRLQRPGALSRWYEEERKHDCGGGEKT